MCAFTCSCNDGSVANGKLCHTMYYEDGDLDPWLQVVYPCRWGQALPRCRSCTLSAALAESLHTGH